MILIDKPTDINEIGGKAFALFNLKIKNTPSLRVVPASFFEQVKKDETQLDQLKKELVKTLKEGGMYAVRSSAIDEDSLDASFAGVHDSFLNIDKNEVMSRILCKHLVNFLVV